MDIRNIKTVYFIGIKGTGMTALAEVFLKQGIRVFGSDTTEKFFTDDVLKRLGIKVIEGFDARNVPEKVDLVVASAAYYQPVGAIHESSLQDAEQARHSNKIEQTRRSNSRTCEDLNFANKISDLAGPTDAVAEQARHSNNIEVQEVLRRGLPIYTYAEALGMVFNDKFGIAVAGTHGKTTATAMLGQVLEAAGFDPTVVVGSQVLKWQSNARVGASKYFIIEADEYRDNFLNYKPKAVILLNMEYDHPDYFKDFEAYKKSFARLISRVPKDGFVVNNSEQARHSNKDARTDIFEVLKSAKCPIINYRPYKGELKVLGEHNRLNAGAVMTAALKLGVNEKVIKKALAEFIGTSRRLEIRGEINGTILIDDYAHHPSEIQASLRAVREKYPKQKIWAIFQPHTFSRTEALFDDFAKSFSGADELIVLEIYASAREISGKIRGRDLFEAIKKYHNQAHFMATNDEAILFLKKSIKPNEVVITMGAGDVGKIVSELMR